MEMWEVELVNTEVGDIPVTIKTLNNGNKTTFVGKTIYSETNIQIETPTRESCLIGVANAFDLYLNQWLEKQLSNVQTKTSKD